MAKATTDSEVLEKYKKSLLFAVILTIFGLLLFIALALTLP